jgi:hypothetical protein
MKTTTLSKIENFKPARDMWLELLFGLRKFESDDEPLPYSKILEICGLQFALWTTRTETDFRWVKELALSFARHIQYLIADPRSIRFLDVAERFLRGESSEEELEEARKDAYAALIADVPPVSYAAAACAYSAAYYAASTSASDSSSGATETVSHARDSHDEAHVYYGDERSWQEDEFRRVVG